MAEDKYHPLFEHLLYNGKGEIRMTFAQVERIMGRKLPPSARKRPSWWSNNPTGHTQAAGGWLRAGYRTSNVDLAQQAVTFKLEGWPDRNRTFSWPPKAAPRGLGEESADFKSSETPATSDSHPQSGKQNEKPHPAWGVWAGKVTLLPDYDYTQPADPDWGKVYDD